MIKTVIRAPNHLGDTLMAQGAIRSLIETSPDTDFHLLVPEWAVAVYKDIPYLQFLPLKPNQLHGFSAVLEQVRILRREKFACGVVLTPSFSSALVMYLAGIKSRYGYTGDGRNSLLNNRIPREDAAGLHRSMRYHYLLERVAMHPLDVLIPRMTPGENALETARSFLRENDIDEKQRFMVIAPQAVAESRRWGSDNYASLAERILNELDMAVVLIGTKNEYKAGQEIKRDHHRIVNLCGKTDIAFASAVMSLASGFVGNDSGLAHLAAAVGIPLTVLSGADDPRETSPISEMKKVIIKDELDCISCVKNICPQKGERFMRCMKEIDVDKVFDNFKELLRIKS